MSAISYYKDLCKEIDVLETRIRDLEHEHEYMYASLNNGAKKPLLRPDIALERMREICDSVEFYSTILAEKEDTRKHMEKRISELDSVDYRVAYRRDILGMTLTEIAVDMGYSYGWIKKLSMRNKKSPGVTAG